MNLILTFNKTDYYQTYSFTNYNYMLPMAINISKFEPHLTLKNNINSKFSKSHKIYSYNNNYEIYLDNTKLLSLDSNANLNTNGSLTIKNLYFTGDIYSKDGNNLTSLYSNLSQSNFILYKNNIDDCTMGSPLSQ